MTLSVQLESGLHLCPIPEAELASSGNPRRQRTLQCVPQDA